MKKQYLIYSDESYKNGPYFSNFYGGALLEYKEIETISNHLNSKKEKLNFGGEIKWTKVSANYLDKYIEIINLFFNYIKKGKIKIRIMFRQNAFVDNQLTKEQHDNEFQLLYYQFIKHAFGLDYALSNSDDSIALKLYFDSLPDTLEKNDIFKEHILYLNRLFDNNITIKKEDIVEIDSKKHVILQCVDIILGAINFKLNNFDKEINPITNKPGKRTIAKAKLYKVIIQNIKEINPNFNIGISTGIRGNPRNVWLDSYRHWRFMSKNSKLDATLTKKFKKINSISPTKYPTDKQ